MRLLRAVFAHPSGRIGGTIILLFLLGYTLYQDQQRSFIWGSITDDVISIIAIALSGQQLLWC